MKRLISPSSGGGTTGGFRGEHRTEGSFLSSLEAFSVLDSGDIDLSGDISDLAIARSMDS